jgi:hypothetical protein
MRPLVVAVLACACLLGAAPARADGPATDVQAHQAYERGTAAYRRKDYATAAREYAAADALSPNPVALQAAIDATIQGDDPVLGLQLVERARGAPRTSALLSTMLVAQQKFAHRTGRIGVACPAQPCLATIDGAAIDPSQPTVVRVGAHTVMVESGGSTITRTLTVPPDETVTLTPSSSSPSPSSPPASSPTAAPSTAPSPSTSPAPAPPPSPAPSPADASDLSPVWFFATLGATAVAGGLTLASGIDTSNKSSAFSACRAPGAPSDCGQLASDGQSAQTRTNVLLGVTAALGLTTVALVPFVRWHHITAAVTAGGLAFDARF